MDVAACSYTILANTLMFSIDYAMKANLDI